MTSDAQKASRVGVHEFEAGGRRVRVERSGRLWKLSVDGREAESRDLSAGIDQLLGTGA